MKKVFLTLAVFVMAIYAKAQMNQYFWYQGKLMMGNSIAQIDSVTFVNEDTDSILIYLPRTIIKTIEVHDTMYVIVHDTVSQKNGYMGHEYVDLGLPSELLWATCNIGAESINQAGDYYAWGETETKYSYTNETYIYSNNRITLNDISTTQYDAARVNWGGEWKMPSRNDVAELTANCTRKDTTINGVQGLIFRGSNGNYIFVPCCGHKDANGVIGEPEGIGFWTSTASGSSNAYRAWEWSYISLSPRCEGFPIRPVVSKSDDVIAQTIGNPTPQIIHDTVYITIHDTICPVEETFHNGFRYVDLGLSVMWADANVGAENPEDYGSFFAYGETSQKSSYGYYNYAHGQYTTMSKYCTNDNLTTLLPVDDAASVNMEGNWRTPTVAEWNELIDNCTISRDTINAHPGYRFTASNGNSIFLPQGGNMWGSRHDNIGTDAYYWSSVNDLYEHAYTFGDVNGDPGRPATRSYVSGNINLYISINARHIGFNVRGVFTR